MRPSFRQRLPHLAAALICASLSLPQAHAQPAAKAPIHGLVTMGRLAFVTDPSLQPDNSLREANTHAGVYAGAVILATWAQLEPARGQYDFSAIETGLASLRAYNARNKAAPLAGKLRVFGGALAPDWVKQLDGGPVTITERGRSMQLGHFWSPPYRAAWTELQQALAARYDANPLIQEVAISSCAAASAEPFVIPLTAANLPALTTAGYTDAAMQQCLMGAIDDYAAWKTTAIDYTFNPFRTIATGHPRPLPAFTEQVMEAFRQRLGARGVIANHGLTPDIAPRVQGVIDDMHRLGPPIEFQTLSPNLDWDAVLHTAEGIGATEMEIWDSRDAGGNAPVTMDELRHWRAELVH
jgi:hypothetical protein